jgi:ABC-2 type transport system permease protein
LFIAGAALMVFAMTALGIFMATIAGSMPQFALLMMLVLLPLEILSGAMTPRESMPQIIQIVTLASPYTHFILLSEGILFRGAGLDVVWPQFAALTAIGLVLFWLALARFRRFMQ